ncbi:MAG: HPr family phosphocarrier protein [Oscillospiraceae bacterium]|nr:HPr family phosphocarrier protein [Oscillospiraceae bacterium]
MTSKEIIIDNKVGLYAKPATLFVQAAARFRSDILISKEEKHANAKSLLGVLSLGICRGNRITLTASGVDEEAALDALSSLLSSNFAEEDSAESVKSFA